MLDFWYGVAGGSERRALLAYGLNRCLHGFLLLVLGG